METHRTYLRDIARRVSPRARGAAQGAVFDHVLACLQRVIAGINSHAGQSHHVALAMRALRDWEVITSGASSARVFFGVSMEGKAQEGPASRFRAVPFELLPTMLLRGVCDHAFAWLNSAFGGADAEYRRALVVLVLAWGCGVPRENPTLSYERGPFDLDRLVRSAQPDNPKMRNLIISSADELASTLEYPGIDAPVFSRVDAAAQALHTGPTSLARSLLSS